MKYSRFTGGDSGSGAAIRRNRIHPGIRPVHRLQRRCHRLAVPVRRVRQRAAHQVQDADPSLRPARVRPILLQLVDQRPAPERLRRVPPSQKLVNQLRADPFLLRCRHKCCYSCESSIYLMALTQVIPDSLQHQAQLTATVHSHRLQARALSLRSPLCCFPPRLDRLSRWCLTLDRCPNANGVSAKVATLSRLP